MLDLERFIQIGIPDIAPVYGGVRGRTISSHKQAYAWKTVVAAGLRQVIDLRKDYSADRYPGLCRQYGVDYFHYPIDNDRETKVLPDSNRIIQIKRSHRASLFVYNNNVFIVLSVIAQGGKQFVVFRFCADSYAKAIVA